MTAAEAICSVLLIAGVAVLVVASLGTLVLGDALARLHSVGLATAAGVGLIVAAVLVAYPADQFSVKAVLLALLAWCLGPMLSHVQASLAYRARTSDRAVPSSEAGDSP